MLPCPCPCKASEMSTDPPGIYLCIRFCYNLCIILVFHLIHQDVSNGAKHASYTHVFHPKPFFYNSRIRTISASLKYVPTFKRRDTTPKHGPLQGGENMSKKLVVLTRIFVDAYFRTFCIGTYLCRKRTGNGETFRKKNIFQLYKKKWEELWCN